LAAVTRSEMLVFVPLALLALAAPGPSHGSMSTGRRWMPPLLYLTGLALVLAPFTAHNLRRGDFVIVASSGGENLYVGNQAGAQGGHRALHHQAGDLFSQRALAKRLAEEAEGRALRPSQISAYWRRLALRDILEGAGGEELKARMLAIAELAGRMLNAMSYTRKRVKSDDPQEVRSTTIGGACDMPTSCRMRRTARSTTV